MTLKSVTLASLAVMLVSPAHAQTYNISMPLGGSSGDFFVHGSSLADFINQNTTDIRVVPSTSGGSVENIRLVGSGSAEFALAFSGDIFNAWSGEGFEREYKEYRLIGPAQKTLAWNFIVLEDSGITSVQDLKGQQFVPGAPGSGGAADADMFLEHAGIADDIDISYQSWGELGRMLSDGDIVGFNRVGAVPAGFIQEIDATHPARVLDLSVELEESGLLDSLPYLEMVDIPADTYRGQSEDATTFGQGAQWIVHQDVPDEVVMKFIELAYSEEAASHLDRTFSNHDHRNEDWAQTLFIPLHPAAETFWSSHGVEIPEPLNN
nr:TAXI family TRAP transporter solute-binding subunit [Halomonas socia]